jgi:hypothetical protein
MRDDVHVQLDLSWELLRMAMDDVRDRERGGLLHFLRGSSVIHIDPASPPILCFASHKSNSTCWRRWVRLATDAHFQDSPQGVLVRRYFDLFVE